MDVPDLLLAAIAGETSVVERVVAVLRALAGPERGRDNCVLMTGNILHTLADLVVEQYGEKP